MHLKRSFAVIGGDLRQRCLLRQLRGLGFPASAYRVPDAEDSAPDLSGCLRGANVLILPMPAGGGVPLADILDAAEPGALICGGMLAPAEALLQARGIAFYDYAKDEALLLQNAELTAEAALALLLEDVYKRQAEYLDLRIYCRLEAAHSQQLLKANQEAPNSASRRCKTGRSGHTYNSALL